MVTLQLNRSLSGDYGFLPAGHIIEVDERTAESLEKRGLATRCQKSPSNGTIHSKMETPYENKMLDAFAPVDSATEKSFSFLKSGRRSQK